MFDQPPAKPDQIQSTLNTTQGIDGIDVTQGKVKLLTAFRQDQLALTRTRRNRNVDFSIAIEFAVTQYAVNIDHARLVCHGLVVLVQTALADPDFVAVLGEAYSDDGLRKELDAFVAARVRKESPVDGGYVVFDRSGAVMSESKLSGIEEIAGAGFEGKNSASAAQAFERKIGYLFNVPDIKAALAP